MLSLELLRKHTSQAERAVRELFKSAIQNQPHRNDILALVLNGFYYKEAKLFNEPGVNFTPFAFGPYDIGHAEETQYKFYHAYRKNYFSGDVEEYYKNLKTDEALLEQHRISVQIELMVYQKIFEEEAFLKKMYQLVRLASGLDYDWFFEIKKYKEETNKGRSYLIWKEIKTPLKNICPLFYDLLDQTYRSQIRNASAHSEFYFLGDNIILTNKDSKPWNNLHGFNLREWDERIHKVILMKNSFINYYNLIEQRFIKHTIGKHFGPGLRTTDKDGTVKYQHIRLRQRSDLSYDWMWYNSYARHYMFHP